MQVLNSQQRLRVETWVKINQWIFARCLSCCTAGLGPRSKGIRPELLTTSGSQLTKSNGSGTKGGDVSRTSSSESFGPQG